ncbi:MAG TPA: helix-turn-helix domain-containing protein [Promicromonospora sp.]|nr:helix-turn-helix domain-containing protein [Promicromonospora sp.]
MAETPGRRERKKAATRRTIADAALRLFFERGYDAVGIRDVAAEADVAVTTLFSHFASKEALVFDQDESVERRLVAAATEREPGEGLVAALRRETHALVRHCTAGAAADLWRMIDATEALRRYEMAMRRRHAEALAEALAGAAPDHGEVARQALARFVVDAFGVARTAEDPAAAVDEVFHMIDAAWAAAGSS